MRRLTGNMQSKPFDPLEVFWARELAMDENPVFIKYRCFFIDVFPGIQDKVNSRISNAMARKPPTAPSHKPA